MAGFVNLKFGTRFLHVEKPYSMNKRVDKLIIFIAILCFHGWEGILYFVPIMQKLV